MSDVRDITSSSCEVTLPASNNNRLLSVPARIVNHHLGVGRDILRGQLRQLVRLGVDPAQWLHLLEETKNKGLGTICQDHFRVLKIGTADIYNIMYIKIWPSSMEPYFVIK